MGFLYVHLPGPFATVVWTDFPFLPLVPPGPLSLPRHVEEGEVSQCQAPGGARGASHHDRSAQHQLASGRE
ncbi:hypothetical protein [Cystobacter fuscus]|uniref:hypothetical protein n=1 Tax=Cystobacter fuscus TaxID=43 RepID=UPI001FE01993|nr:hypothetical protein [Cystobacter fuscus]